MKTNRITSTPVLLLAAMNFRNHLPIPQWAVKEGMNQKTSPPALVLAAIGFWHTTRAGAGSGRHEQREHRDQPTSFATGGHESHGGRLWRGTMLPDWALPMLQIQSSALSVICVWNSGKMTDGKKFFKHHQMTNTKCLQKQGHDRRQACPECGKKFAGPRQRYVSTWDVAQPWGINEPTPTPMKWGGRQWKAFPFPIQWGGPAPYWEEEWRGGGKKGCAKPTETCRHDRHKHWHELTQTPKKTHPPPKKTQMKKKQLLAPTAS